jgi:hypothetical protein
MAGALETLSNPVMAGALETLSNPVVARALSLSNPVMAGLVPAIPTRSDLTKMQPQSAGIQL